MAQVAAALEEAHSHGVVHRDLKSANVLLASCPAVSSTRTSVTSASPAATAIETTSAGGVLGTLEYLAPERQSGAPASVATDIYSLGCLLWAALTGAPPYRGSDVDIALAHLRAPVPQLPGDDPVSRRGERHRRPCDGQGARRDRYVSAREMREDLVALRALATEQELLAATSPRHAGAVVPRWRRSPASRRCRHDRLARPRPA